MPRGPLLLAAVVLLSVVAGASPVTAQEQVTLTVSVVDQSGAAVGGATIDASWDGGGTSATTATNGKAFVDVPRGADVTLEVTADRYVRNSPVRVENAQSEDVTVDVARKGKLTVTTTNDGQPLSGVTVEVKKRGAGSPVVEAKTGSDGTLTTPTIEQGEYYLRLSKAGFYRNATYVTVNQSASASFSMAKGTTNVEFRVVDDHFDEPRTVTDAQVKVQGIGTQRTSAGTVTFTVPVNDFYRVSATKRGYESNETQFFVGTSQEQRTLVINRERALTVVPANERVVVGEKVTVTVRNAYNETIQGATVTRDGQTVGQTDQRGEVRFAIESAGPHEIAASADGVTSATVNVTGVAVDEDGNTVTQSEGTPKGTEPLPLPGFGPAVAVVAVLGAAFLLRRR